MVYIVSVDRHGRRLSCPRDNRSRRTRADVEQRHVFEVFVADSGVRQLPGQRAYGGPSVPLLGTTYTPTTRGSNLRLAPIHHVVVVPAAGVARETMPRQLREAALREEALDVRELRAAFIRFEVRHFGLDEREM